jgi:hypothetical protein
MAVSRRSAVAEPDHQRYRRQALRALTNRVGVYALCDLDEVPIYVGQSVDGIRARVNRHLTSARSDVIANRQIDVWEIAYVKAWPVNSTAEIDWLEAVLFEAFDQQKRLMNGSVPPLVGELPEEIPRPDQTIRVMSDKDIRIRRDPSLRLPRQIEHIGRLVDHILNVKDSPQLRQALGAHFERLDRYRHAFLQEGARVIRAVGTTKDE